MRWMILPLRRYAQFRGRSRRMEFWLFLLFQLLVGVIASIVDRLLGFGQVQTLSGPFGYSYASTDNGPVAAVAALLLIVPSISVAARRLHDIDRSGWWLLLILLPILGWFTLLIFYCLDGTRGPNRHGADPKDPDDTRRLTRAPG